MDFPVEFHGRMNSDHCYLHIQETTDHLAAGVPIATAVELLEECRHRAFLGHRRAGVLISPAGTSLPPRPTTLPVGELRKSMEGRGYVGEGADLVYEGGFGTISRARADVGRGKQEGLGEAALASGRTGSGGIRERGSSRRGARR